MAKTSIEWCATYHADGTLERQGATWNPVSGCTPTLVSSEGEEAHAAR